MQVLIVVGGDKVDEEIETEGRRDDMVGNFQRRRLQLWEGKEQGHHHRVQHYQSITTVLALRAGLHSDEGVPPNSEPVVRVYHAALLSLLLAQYALLNVAIEFFYRLQVLDPEHIIILHNSLILMLIRRLVFFRSYFFIKRAACPHRVKPACLHRL